MPMFMTMLQQGGGTPIYPILRSSSSVKVKVKSQAKNLQLVKGQTRFRNCIQRSILLKYQRERKITKIY